MKQTIEELRHLQEQPLERKILMTRQRIREWVEHFGEDGVYVSFSGGKDSTVLLDIVRNEGYTDIPAVFVDVPTQFPELRDFAKTFDNVEIIQPKISFYEVCDKYGFPLISKEVSECVQGARKYLTQIMESDSVLDRQTDRQTDRQYRYYYDKVCGLGKYAKSDSWGGDRKYRKLRGIGEFAKPKDASKTRGQQSAFGSNVGDADEGSEDKGEYP